MRKPNDSEVDEDNNRYISFSVYNSSTDECVELSCVPDAGVHGLIPIFFNPEVLSKYRNNPDKYQLHGSVIDQDGSMLLRGVSHTDSQVSCHLHHLGILPYNEQLYWKSYNEKQNSKVSDVTIEREYNAQFCEEQCDLKDLERILENFPNDSCSAEIKALWKPKESLEILFGRVNPVITTNNKDYKDYILCLAILVIDGFNCIAIKKLLDVEPEKEGSIGTLKLLLVQWGISCQKIEEIIKPIKLLQQERSKYAAHAGKVIDFNIKVRSLEITRNVKNAISLLSEVLQNK